MIICTAPPVDTTLSLVSPGDTVTEGDNDIRCRATFTNSPSVTSLSFNLYLNDVRTSGGGSKTTANGGKTVTYRENSVNIARSVTQVKCELIWESGRSFAQTEGLEEKTITVQCKCNITR